MFNTFYCLILTLWFYILKYISPCLQNFIKQNLYSIHEWHNLLIALLEKKIIVASWQNQQNDCTQRRLRSAWASAQSDQRLCYLHEESLGP